MVPQYRQRLRQAALDVCRAVRAAVAAVPLAERALRVPALLKPPPEAAAAPDVAGERAACMVLAGLASDLGVEVRLVVDPCSGRCLRIAPTVLAALRGKQQRQQQEKEEEGGGQEQHVADGLPPGVELLRELAGGDGGGRDGGSTIGGDAERLYVYLDAVDGTLLLSGLTNDPSASPPVLRLAGAGAWAVGVALTDPSRTPLAELRLRDFTVAAVADGALAACRPCGCACDCGPGGTAAGPVLALQPSAAVAVWEDGAPGGGSGSGGTYAAAVPQGDNGGGGGRYVTFDASSELCLPAAPAPARGLPAPALGLPAAAPPPPQPPLPRLHTTTCRQLAGTFAYLDAFQALDAASARPGDAELARRLFALLGNRHDGGAFDVVRAYGNLGALLRSFFGWRERSGAAAGGGVTPLWLEPQCGAFVVVNENLANLIPAVPLVLGAGGEAVDLSSAPLIGRRLAEGRTSVVYAGNVALRGAVLALAACAVGAAAGSGGQVAAEAIAVGSTTA